MSCQEQNRVPQVSSQPYVPENLKSEIANLNSKIENLQLSEDERLVKELQAIELSIAQAERNTEPVSESTVQTVISSFIACEK